MHHTEHDLHGPAGQTGSDADDLEAASADRDAGATLMELLVVVVILGLLIAVLLVGLTGMKSQAAESTCSADERQVHVAAESYFATTGGRTIPPTGSDPTDPDRYERTLVAGGFLRDISEFHDLDAAGVTITKAGTQC